MTNFKKIIATRCENCPLCKHARKNPETLFGKIMHWHGSWCPFWKAWVEEYGQKKKEESLGVN